MTESKKDHFDWVAENDSKQRRFQAGFHKQISEILKARIPRNSTILEGGCGTGTLLRSLDPQRGVGIDLSERMIEKAQSLTTHDRIQFRAADISTAVNQETFDHIVCDYLLGYIDDIQSCLERLKESGHSQTRLHITSLNSVWKPLLSMGQKLGWVVRQPPSNWLSTSDIINLLEMSGWEVVSHSAELILPFDIPLLSDLFNRYAARLPGLRHLGSTILITARKRCCFAESDSVSCSVIVPARNEAGNIRPALDRIPSLGKETEIIFIEGNSDDDTWETIQREVAAYNGPHKVKYAQQPGKGKWDAVRLGFSMASGDILVIQDGDLTAPPEDLPKFFNAICDGTCEFANGSRLVYPMESRAMRFLNLLGNKFFAITLSYILGQTVKDSLCGTKMMTKTNYQKLMDRIKEFGDFDPFGDFNLLFGSSLLHLRIRDIPVRYKDRLYGDTNISRFRHGVILLKMTWFGLLHIKFQKIR